MDSSFSVRSFDMGKTNQLHPDARAIEPNPLPILAGDDSESIVLNLMQPPAAGWRRVGSGGEARRNEPDRQGTLQHADLNRVEQR
jgi:hypothetical protein